MIHIEKRAFPGVGKTLIFFNKEGELKKNAHYILLDKKLEGKLTAAAATHDFTGKKHEHFTVEGGTSFGHIVVYGTGKDREMKPAEFREYLASALRAAGAFRTPSVHFFYPGQLDGHFFETGKEIALAFYLSQYRFDKYKGKREKDKKHAIQDLYICADRGHDDLQRGVKAGGVIARGVNLARDLVNEPASHVHPATLVQEARRIAKESKGRITVEVLGRQECARLGMGAFLGVAAGSEHEPEFIVLTYKPNSKPTPSQKICFVGKSITFDSGGLSLKPSKAMEDMKIDMAGGAAVLGVFQALAEGIEVSREVYGIMAACENMPSGTAMRPGDIVTAMNGKTIEVLNTDAEGRLTLADAISYAEKKIGPDIIIDFATLTGACMVALGDDIAGVFGNDRATVKRFLDAVKYENEAAWELPYYKPYAELLKSDIADIKNVSSTGYGGAITGALFIGDFVEKAKWIHVDIAGPAHNTGKVQGSIGRGGTGWGVVSIINFLQET